MSFLASTEPSTLAEGALAVVALAYLLPPMAKASADKLRGYAGGLPPPVGPACPCARRRLPVRVACGGGSAAVLMDGEPLNGSGPMGPQRLAPPPPRPAGDILPSTAFDALVSQGGNLLVDIRTAEEKEAAGVPDLPDMGEGTVSFFVCRAALGSARVPRCDAVPPLLRRCCFHATLPSHLTATRVFWRSPAHPVCAPRQPAPPALPFPGLGSGKYVELEFVEVADDRLEARLRNATDVEAEVRQGRDC